MNGTIFLIVFFAIWIATAALCLSKKLSFVISIGGGFITACIGIFLFAVITGNTAGDKESAKADLPVVQHQKKPPHPIHKPEMPDYLIIKTELYDEPVKAQIVLHAVVSGTITEDNLKLLLTQLYNESMNRQGFHYNNGKPSHVFIYLYTSREHFLSGMGQWIAMLCKIGNQSKTDIQVKKELLAQQDAEPEVKFGLAEDKRRQIFRALCTAEGRADKEASRVHPIPNPGEPDYSAAEARNQLLMQARLKDSLITQYEKEVADAYGLSSAQLSEISAEGIKKNWTIPSN